MPRVSVIIPTFNCARFLGRAIGSVLDQTFTDYEILLVDDGSTDETPELVAGFGGRVRYLYQANRGPTPARNFALTQASGDLIAYLDADDMWYPDKLAKQVAFLDAHEGCGLVHSETTIIDEMDRVIHLRFNREKGGKVPVGHCTLDLLRRNNVQFLTVLERRECLERTGRFDERVKGVGDYYQWILVAMDGMTLGYIDEPLAMYRWRADSLSTNRSVLTEELITMYEILLAEKGLAARFGQEAVDIVRTRLYELRRDLSYFDRHQGHQARARRRVLRLIWEWPQRAELYLEMLKACVPTAMAARLRTLRERRG
jgi:hypothetical protein